MKKADMVGKRFGRLVVVSRAPDRVTESGYHTVMMNCKCDCGNSKIVRSKCLTSGITSSCGCFAKESMSKRASKHNGYGTKLYAIWNSMRQRCYNPNNHAFNNYGARGISVCSEWDDFNVFRSWALKTGYSEVAKRGCCTLDRIDVNKSYSPDNCRWADMRAQSNNRRMTIFISANGQTHSISEWSNILGIKYQTLWRRYKSGWSSEKIINKKVG